MSKHQTLLRSRDSHARVTFVELFFDLVFVFAVTQLSHTLLEHLTLGGALETLFLLLAVWWVWMYTCWFTNWIDPDKPSVRALMFVLMFAGFSVIPFISPYMVTNVGLKETDLPYLYLFGGLATAFSSRYIGKLADRHGKR